MRCKYVRVNEILRFLDASTKNLFRILRLYSFDITLLKNENKLSHTQSTTIYKEERF